MILLLFAKSLKIKKITFRNHTEKILFFKSFLFYIGVKLNNNVVIVSGEQQRDSAIHTHVSILPQTPLPSRLPHNIEQSSLCYAVGPCWLSILNIAVCTCWSQIPWLSLPPILIPWELVNSFFDFKIQVQASNCRSHPRPSPPPCLLPAPRAIVPTPTIVFFTLIIWSVCLPLGW